MEMPPSKTLGPFPTPTFLRADSLLFPLPLPRYVTKTLLSTPITSAVDGSIVGGNVAAEDLGDAL